MKQAPEKKSKILFIIFYFLIFYGIWSLWEFCGRGIISNTIKSEYLSQFIQAGIIKNLVWTLPALFLVHYFNSDVYVNLKDMFTARVNIFKYISIFLGFTLYLLIGAFITKGRLAISNNFKYSDLIGLIFVGITEEMVFRGWLLNLTVNENSKWLPVIINAFMFLLIHFPIWIVTGQFVSSFTGFGFVCILILSVIFSLSFIKSKSIWVPVALHTYWDFMVLLFF